ncbi:MAG: c-type cytochrome [Deltaproteobacteria bacterium]|nr:c-type cytochrome [Deltaproteobacteria bacterium]
MARGVLSTCIGVLLAVGCNPATQGSTDGKILFEATCAKCHGYDGKGHPVDKVKLGVPDMTEEAWHDRLSDEDMARTIRKGSKSGKMPGFGTALSDPQIEAVIKHVRTLRGR